MTKKDDNNNTGVDNSGDKNSGDRNSGDWNSGDKNSGDWNSGDRNSGDGNSGYWNSGDGNSGNGNSGDGNSGNGNSGYGNSTNRSSGIFCSEESTVRIFNKETKLKWDEIDHPHFIEFCLNKWISENDMTDEEKKADSEFYVREGYLKTFTWEEAWANFWRDTDEENRQKVLNLPNFDWDVFTSITGIKNEISETKVKDEITVDGIKYRRV